MKVDIPKPPSGKGTGFALPPASTEDNQNEMNSFGDASDTDESSDERHKGDDESTRGADDLAVTKNQTRAVNVVRICFLLVFVAVAVAVSYAAYAVTKQNETDVFESTFTDQAGKVKEAFERNADRRMAALQGFSQTITSYAVSSGSVFPNVTLPDFERQAAYALRLSDAVALLTFPIVYAETKAEWEAYAVENQGWLGDGLAAQAETIGIIGGEEDTVDKLRDHFNEGDVLDEEESAMIDEQQLITPIIFKVDPTDGSVGPETGPGPYAPIWQFSPALTISQLINFNSFSHPTRARELAKLVETQQPLMSSAADFRDEDPLTVNRESVMNLFLNRWRNGTFEYEEGPVSDVYFPIFDQNGPDKQMKSVLTAYVYWQSFFANILPEDAVGILVILRNTCGQAFSYEVNGKAAEYLGKGDWHDPKYDDMVVSTGLGAVLGAGRVPEGVSDTTGTGQCFYSVEIYPSETTEESFKTNTPAIFAIALAVVFVFTTAVFFLYDRCLARRHRVVESTAVKSTAVVSSLFPAAVRERLYDTAATDGKNGKNLSIASDVMSSEFLASTQMNRGPMDLGDIETSEPIADLYPNCTVFFADIAGFTKWSSSRQPSDVFRLLESIYGTLDKLANHRKVFKVETIGDCYVAVTGLPKAQPDHAIRMTRFAAECMTKMNQVVHRLVLILGDDTAALSMRCGLHSGAVTAGILRGDKARFQLFGDTVNTAARMESTSQPGHIQVSEETASLLRARGKNGWIRRREDAITPKGKGLMTTYWVQPQAMNATNTESLSVVSSADERIPSMSSH